MFVAPADAVAAAVFALGDGTGKVEVRRVTFRAPAAGPLPLPPFVDARRYKELKATYFPHVGR